MKIRIFSTVSDDVYRITMYTEDWSQGDLKLMQLFGEPEIDLGGAFTGPPSFSLPNRLVRIATGSPFSQSFDARDFANADERAVVWDDAIQVKIQAAVTTLRALQDTFTGEEVVNV